MTDDHDHLFLARRKVIYAMLVFTVLAVLLNTSIFVNWAREAPFSPEVTEWMIAQADRIGGFGQSSGFSALSDWIRGAVEDIRMQ